MKKISLMFASVLISSLAFAKDSDKPKPSSSSVVVTNSKGSTLFKLRYTSEKVQKYVRLTLLDERGNSIYTETINKTEAFIRPYNFKGLPDGQYSIQVEDENGRTLEKINFNSNESKSMKSVHISKVPGETNKYALIISSLQKDNVTINILDKQNNVVYTEDAQVNGGFGKVYVLEKLKDFTIEVSDANGLVKSVQF